MTSHGIRRVRTLQDGKGSQIVGRLPSTGVASWAPSCGTNGIEHPRPGNMDPCAYPMAPFENGEEPVFGLKVATAWDPSLETKGFMACRRWLSGASPRQPIPNAPVPRRRARRGCAPGAGVPGGMRGLFSRGSPVVSSLRSSTSGSGRVPVKQDALWMRDPPVGLDGSGNKHGIRDEAVRPNLKLDVVGTGGLQRRRHASRSP